MPSVFSIKQDIIKASQACYDAVSKEDKEKSRENLQKQFKKFHWFRHSHKKDYENIEKIIRNIL